MRIGQNKSVVSTSGQADNKSISVKKDSIGSFVKTLGNKTQPFGKTSGQQNQPTFSRQEIQQAVENLKTQQSQQIADKTAVYQVIKGRDGKEKFVGLDKEGNLLLQEYGNSVRNNGKGSTKIYVGLNKQAQELVLQAESKKFLQERSGKNEAAVKEVTVGKDKFLLAIDKDGKLYQKALGTQEANPSLALNSFGKRSKVKLDAQFQAVIVEGTLNGLKEQRANGATGDLVKALEYGGMNKLVALRADGKSEVIDFGMYKAKNGTEALAVDKAIQELRAWQQANPGQIAKKKIKINKKISFEITLNADGSIQKIKRKKKKKKGFFAKIFEGIGKVFSKILPVLSVVSMFIPFSAPLTIGLRVANAAMGLSNAIKNKNILGAIGSVAGAFGGSLANTFNKVINTASTIKNIAQNGIRNVWDGIANIGGIVGDWAGGTLGKIGNYASQLGSTISSFKAGDVFNGVLGIGRIAGTANQDIKAANFRNQQAVNKNRNNQDNQQLMIGLNQPLFDLTLGGNDRVSQAYNQIYARMNQRQQAAIDLAIDNARRRGITDPVGIQNYLNQNQALLRDIRSLGADGLRIQNDARRGIFTFSNNQSFSQVVSGDKTKGKPKPNLSPQDLKILRDLPFIDPRNYQRNPNDALYEIRMKLGVPLETLLKYTNPQAYNPTDLKVVEANRLAQRYGYDNLSQLAGQYKVWQAAKYAALDRQVTISAATTVPIYVTSKINADAFARQNPNLSIIRNNDGTVRGFFVPNNEQGASLASNVVFGLISQGFAVERPNVGSQSFQNSYQKASLLNLAYVAAEAGTLFFGEVPALHRAGFSGSVVRVNNTTELVQALRPTTQKKLIVWNGSPDDFLNHLGIPRSIVPPQVELQLNLNKPQIISINGQPVPPQNVQPTSRRLTPKEYDSLRRSSPPKGFTSLFNTSLDASRRQSASYFQQNPREPLFPAYQFNDSLGVTFDKRGNMYDAATNRSISPQELVPDHIYPFNKITQIPGFADLTPANQSLVVNNPDNLILIWSGINSSRGDTPWIQVHYYKKGQSGELSVDSDFRQYMSNRETYLQIQLEQQVQDLLNSQGKPRK